MTDGLRKDRKSHLRKVHQVGLSEVGLSEGNPHIRNPDRMMCLQKTYGLRGKRIVYLTYKGDVTNAGQTNNNKER